MDGVLSPIDVMLGQIGCPNGMLVRTCSDHGRFLVPRGSKFTCPSCNNLHSTPTGTEGNGDTAEVTQAKSNAINSIKHYVSLG